MPTFTPAAGVPVYFQERKFLLYTAYDDNRWLAVEDLAFPMGAGMVLLNISDMSPTPPDDTSAAQPSPAQTDRVESAQTSSKPAPSK